MTVFNFPSRVDELSRQAILVTYSQPHGMALAAVRDELEGGAPK